MRISRKQNYRKPGLQPLQTQEKSWGKKQRKRRRRRKGKGGDGGGGVIKVKTRSHMGGRI